jgi:hypothetical protein
MSSAPIFPRNDTDTDEHFQSTGKLVEDRNSGYCPKTAEQECRSRRDDTAALHDEPSVAIPENMKARHVIQKRHLNRL